MRPPVLLAPLVIIIRLPEIPLVAIAEPVITARVALAKRLVQLILIMLVLTALALPLVRPVLQDIPRLPPPLLLPPVRRLIVLPGRSTVILFLISITASPKLFLKRLRRELVRERLIVIVAR